MTRASHGMAASLSIALLSAPMVHASSTITITWLLPTDTEVDAYAHTVATQYEKENPGIKIDVITPGSTAYNEKLLTMVAAGQTPDIFTDWANTGVYTIISHHLAQDLNPFFKADKISSSFIPATYKKEYTEDNHLYGLPWLSNPTFIAYNETLFNKYHVPLPTTSWTDKSWTLNKLLADAKKLTHLTSNPKTSDWGVDLTPGSIGSLGWLWGVDPLNNKGGPTYTAAYRGGALTQTYATQPKEVEAMQWLADLSLKDHVMPDQGTLTAMSTTGNAFFSGHIAISEVAGWVWRQAAQFQPKFKWGIVPIPYGPGGADTAQREDNAFYLSSTSKHADAAFRFMVFATTGWGAQQLVKVGKIDPPNTNPKYLEEWVAGVDKIAGFSMKNSVFEQVFEGGVNRDFPDPTNLLNDSSDFGDPFTQLMSPVWIGRESAKQGLQAVQSAWQQVLQ